MLFSSPPFFLFFAIYFFFHLVVPLRHRLLLIIVGSTIFYGYWNPFYVLVPHALMLLDLCDVPTAMLARFVGREAAARISRKSLPQSA